MNDTYKSLLSMVIGLSVLSYLIHVHWIAYTILTIAFLGIISEKFALGFIKTIHKIASFIFSLIQKILLIIVYYLIITPISLIKRRGETANTVWITPDSKDADQLKNMW